VTPASTDDLRLEYRPFSLPLSTPLETAAGSIDHREGFLIRIVDRSQPDEPKAVGYGEASPLPGWTESLEACEDTLERAQAAFSRGEFARALEAVDRQVAARHGLTLALADLEATEMATPLYRYLGGEPMVARVPVNATVGDGSPAETASAVESAVSSGFECCKLKVGARSVEEDIERLRRTRRRVGPDVELRTDANEAWTYDEAMAAIDAFADLNVSLLEQPLPAGALEGHAALRGNGVRIALDEGLLEHGVDAICATGAADVVVIKPMAVGGLDIARRIAAWVAELEMESLVTTTIDAVVGRTAAVHLAATIPDVPACGLATGDLLEADLGFDPVLLEDGSAVVPQAKGIGVDGVWEP